MWRTGYLVTDETVEVQDFEETTHHFGGFYTIYLKLIKKNLKMSICKVEASIIDKIKEFAFVEEE